MASPSTSPEHAGEQSQWLHVTLSDLNRKMNAMKTLLEEGNVSDGIERSKKGRHEELLQMLEEFKSSYCSLAEKYDLLRYESDTATDLGPTPPPSSEINKNGLIGSNDIPKFKLFDSDAEAIVKTKFKTEFETREGLDEKDPDCNIGDFEESNGHCALAPATSENLSESSYEWGNTCYDLKSEFTILLEENMQKQEELARRNVEKTMVINNRLRLQLEKINGENRALQSCISCLKVEERQEVQIPQLRKLCSRKFFGVGCS